MQEKLKEAIHLAQSKIISDQFPEGYWWYTLEANESINAEFILLLYYLQIEKEHSSLIQAILKRILSKQNENGSWSIYHEGPGDLSTTIECYWVLKLSGHSIESTPLKKARAFILQQGGIPKSRVFTKIHLALFELIPWQACPVMPLSFLLLPKRFLINIYEFSSWARACLVPLLVVLEKKQSCPLPTFHLDELYLKKPHAKDWQYKASSGMLSWENLFILIDKSLKKIYPRIPRKKLNDLAFKKAEKWIVDHVSKTEDIYPALAYALKALKSLGYGLEHPIQKKCFNALLSFQQIANDTDLPATPLKPNEEAISIYQQCCISPVWDTPWTAVALLESGASASQPRLLKAARWLLKKQVTQTYGDWAIKNKKAEPGGWSFEFENEYFPDVDDTIEVLLFLMKVNLPRDEFTRSFQRGLDWLLSMQSKNGGWAAFDKDNTLEIVNKIPFSDHGACLDPPTPDITGRALELLGAIGHTKDYPVCKKAIRFLLKTQEKNGPWWGRWGVNYLYGTWCVLQGLQAMGYKANDPVITKAAHWLKMHQNKDGGWSESCESYIHKKFIPLKHSTPSQTAWAVMGLIAAGEVGSPEVTKGIQFLIDEQNKDGTWDEQHYTGTGFPGHFYIRYHGYRHYFPLLCLGKYLQQTQN